MARFLFSFYGKAFEFSGRRSEAKAIHRAIRMVENAGRFHYVLEGVKDWRERSKLYFHPDEPIRPLNLPDQYKEACRAVMQDLPSLMKPDEVDGFVKRMHAIFQDHAPRQDLRVSREELRQVEAQAWKEHVAWQTDQVKRKAEFIAHFGRDYVVNVGSRYRGICLEMVYERNIYKPGLTDIPYERHGWPLLLLITPSRRRRENVLRSALRYYPELEKMHWTFQKHYRNGVGNYYLLSQETAPLLVECSENNQRHITQLRYVISLPPGEEFYVYRNYPGRKEYSDPEGMQIHIHYRPAFHGIEVEALPKLGSEKVAWLKAHGYRFVWKNMMWQRRFNPYAWREVHAYLEIPCTEVPHDGDDTGETQGESESLLEPGERNAVEEVCDVR